MKELFMKVWYFLLNLNSYMDMWQAKINEKIDSFQGQFKRKEDE